MTQKGDLKVSVSRREPRLLICDEATSALDTATERGIMDALTVLASGRTSIFVAHRLVRLPGTRPSTC